MHSVALRIRTIHARINIRQIIANTAENDLFIDLAKRFYKILHLCGGPAENVKRKPLCGFVPDARETFKFVDEPSDGF